MYSYTHIGTKRLIEEFIEEIVSALQNEVQELPEIMRTMVLEQFRLSYGKTGLCLSGGAALSQYHYGVVRALLETNLLPNVISGSSGGALTAAHVCVRTDDELIGFQGTLDESLNAHINFGNGLSPWRQIKNFLQGKPLFNPSDWDEMLRWHCKDDMTFLEAFRHTGRVLNITATPKERHSPPMNLNYLTTPNVTVRSAVIASASMPGLLPEAKLIEKTADGQLIMYGGDHGGWFDGSIRTDVPMEYISSKFNVNYLIVSQVNPHVTPFLFQAKSDAHVGSYGEKKYTGRWRGGFILSFLENFLKADIRKYFSVLSELDIIPQFLGGDWRFLFLQNFEGHVTLSPPPSFGDYWQLLGSPSTVETSRFITQGKYMAWRKYSLIRNRFLIEQALAEEVPKPLLLSPPLA